MQPYPSQGTGPALPGRGLIALGAVGGGTCDGSTGVCCDQSDPCGFADDYYCDCPDCAWDAWDCMYW
ncbi:MAG: hypothetical protein HY906_11650 [Deltaproteobacteria bacterium]|nr:hypothetical protein [Deltaproteobacteria bacterium]